MNPDILAPGERCASTSNRNFEGRQGRGSRTHLVSPSWPPPPPSPATSPTSAPGSSTSSARSSRHEADVRRGRLTLMIAINVLTSTAAPLDISNIDTDQIIPKQFLKRIERTGYGEFLFFDWRRIQESTAAAHEDEQPLLAKASSPATPTPPSSSTSPSTPAPRSSSPAKTSAAAPPASTPPGPSPTSASSPSSPPSFADIFFSNAGKNGMILVRLSEADVNLLTQRATTNPQHTSPSPRSPDRHRRPGLHAPPSTSIPSANTASSTASTTSASPSATSRTRHLRSPRRRVLARAQGVAA